MIKLTRPLKTPNILLNKGKTKTQNDCDDFNRNKKDYTSGIKKFNFDSTIYRHKSVKDELKKAQNNKCAYCESKITHISSGDVEHFRPKSGFQNDGNDTLSTLGYYWLVYEWTNLLFSCEICNRIYKKNLFPLSNPSSRSKSHKSNISKEKPLFINPYDEDPKKYIRYRKEIILGKNTKGKKTIELLGLDRTELNEVRLYKYKILETIYILSNSLLPESKEAKEAKIVLATLIANEEYSYMLDEAINAKFGVI